MNLRLVFAPLAILLWQTFPANAFLGIDLGVSCGAGEYKDDTLGICLPTDKKLVDAVDPTKPLRTAAEIITAIANGDGPRATAALGKYLTNSPICIACDTIASNILPGIPKEKLYQITGRGMVVFTGSGGNPYMVVLDFVGNTIQEFKPKPPEPATIPPAPKERGNKVYSGKVDCIAQNSTTVSGWSIAPISLVGPQSSGTLPNVDLYKGDEIKLSAPLCKEFDDPKNGTKSLTSAVMTFDYLSVITGPAGSFKWAIIGVAK